MVDYVALMYTPIPPKKPTEKTTEMTEEDVDGNLQSELTSALGAGPGRDILRVTVSRASAGLDFGGAAKSVTVGVIVDKSKVEALRSSIDNMLGTHGFEWSSTDES